MTYRFLTYIIVLLACFTIFLPNSNAELIWSYKTKSGVWSVAVYGGRVVAGGNNYIYGFDTKGIKIWEYKTNSRVGTISVGNGLVIAGTFGKYVYCFSLDGVLI